MNRLLEAHNDDGQNSHSRLIGDDEDLKKELKSIKVRFFLSFSCKKTYVQSIKSCFSFPFTT